MKSLAELEREAKRRGVVKYDVTVSLLGDLEEDGRRRYRVHAVGGGGPISTVCGATLEEALAKLVAALPAVDLESDPFPEGHPYRRTA